MKNEIDELKVEIAQLRTDIESGERARIFAQSPFYKRDLLPILEKIQSDAAFASMFGAGSTKTVDEIAVNCAIQSGRSQTVEEITTRLNRMIRDSSENVELLANLEQKLKKLEATKK